MDINLKPNFEIPLWSETRWAGFYDPEQNVGLFLHAGRLRNNLEWWWVQTGIYLPEGRIAVDRSWVRNPDNIGVKTSNLDLRVAEEGWLARFDGIVEMSDIQTLGRSVGGASAPTVPASFDVVADGSRPWWDMLEDVNERQLFGDMHVEQAGRCRGRVTVGNESYSIDGVSYYDHSSGVRDWAGFHSHHFAIVAMPDYTLHLGQKYPSPTETLKGGGVYFDNQGKKRFVTRSEMPRMIDVFGAPEKFDWRIKVHELGEMILKVEVLHTFPTTITFDNDNINGIGWDLPGDPLFLTECQVKVTDPDGAVGYGHIERSNPRSCLARP